MIRQFTVQYFQSYWAKFKEEFGGNATKILGQAYGEAKGSCKLCGERKPTKVLPIWKINDELKQLDLHRFVAICDHCHQAVGIEMYSDAREDAAKYLHRILNVSEEEMIQQLDKAYDIYKSTYRYEMNFDKLWYLREAKQNTLRKF